MYTVKILWDVTSLVTTFIHSLKEMCGWKVSHKNEIAYTHQLKH